MENEAAQDIQAEENEGHRDDDNQVEINIAEVMMEPGSASSEGTQVFWDKSGVWEMWGGEWSKKTNRGWWEKWRKDGQ